MNRVIPVSLRELVTLLDGLSHDALTSVADASWALTNVSAIQMGREEKLLDGVAFPNFLFHYRKFHLQNISAWEFYFIAEDERAILKKLGPAEVMFL